MYVYIHINIHIHVHICMYVLHVCIYIYTYVFIHTTYTGMYKTMTPRTENRRHMQGKSSATSSALKRPLFPPSGVCICVCVCVCLYVRMCVVAYGHI